MNKTWNTVFITKFSLIKQQWNNGIELIFDCEQNSREFFLNAG